MANRITSKPDSSASRASQPGSVLPFNLGQLSAWKRWREPLFIFLAFRIGLGVASFFAQLLLPVLPRGGTAPYVPAPLDRWSERLVGVWSHWDGEWFLQISSRGYQVHDGTVAFFPLYPLLVKVVAFLLGGNYLLAGVVVSSGATLVVLLLLYELCLREWGVAVASTTCLYLVVFPMAFFLAAIYSEALFLALTLGAFWCARYLRRWWLAGLLAALATLTRSTGFLLIGPLAWEWWQYSRQQKLTFKFISSNGNSNRNWGFKLVWAKSGWSFLALGLPLLALASWVGYNGLKLGDPFAFFKAQSDWVWNRHSSPPWEAVWRGAQNFFAQWGPTTSLASGRDADPNLWEFPLFVITLLVFGVASWLTWWRRFPLSYLLYFGLAMFLPLTSPSSKEPLLSFPRFALVLFPLFMVLALAGQRWRWFHYGYLYTSLLLLGLFFARFANWYWVA